MFGHGLGQVMAVCSDAGPALLSLLLLLFLSVQRALRLRLLGSSPKAHHVTWYTRVGKLLLRSMQRILAVPTSDTGDSGSVTQFAGLREKLCTLLPR